MKLERKWPYNDRAYVKNSKGHEWKRDEEGDIEIFAYTNGDHHNGPRCVKCGYGFCHHCSDGPQEDCSTQEPHTGEK
jgi:hypothetical protein